MSTDARIRILSIDDHPLMRQGIADMIRYEADMDLVGQASGADEGIQQYRELRPDITLMDVRLPDQSGIDALIALRAEFVNARVLMFSTFRGDVEVQRALAAGARGFLLKTMAPAQVINGIRQVHAGKRVIHGDLATQLAEHFAEDSLSERELEVLRLIAQGGRNQDVADALDISEATVKVHMSHIMQKLNATDRTMAVVIAIRRGIIDVTSDEFDM